MASKIEAEDNGYRVTINKRYHYTFRPKGDGTLFETACGMTGTLEMPSNFEFLMAENRPLAIAALQEAKVGPIRHDGDIRNYIPAR